MVNSETSRYADLIVRAVGLQDGQPLIVRGDPRLWDFYLQVAKAAYARGAKCVDVWPLSNELIRVQADHSKYPSYVVRHRDLMSRGAVEENAAFVRITTPWSPRILDAADQKALSAIYKASREERKALLAATMANKDSWLVVAYPTDGWAQQVLGDSARAEDIWEILKQIVLGPTDDAWTWWQEKSALLEAHAHHLNALSLSELHITGEGTDLRIGLSEQAQWEGGRAKTAGGQVFIPNIPTEEVFTAPDHRRTEGVVAATFPVIIDGKVIEGASFTFEEGKMVDYQAKKGREALRSFFELDEGASRLGEIALVDYDSPVGHMKKLFYDGLLDENAAVHMALGAAYPTNLRDMTVDRKAYGHNASMGHEDIMIGNKVTKVWGQGYDGRKHLLMEGGRVCRS